MQRVGVVCFLAGMLLGCQSQQRPHVNEHKKVFIEEARSLVESISQSDPKDLSYLETEPTSKAFEPLNYTLFLDIDPAQEKFSGEVSISVKSVEKNKPLILDADASLLITGVTIDGQVVPFDRLKDKIQVEAGHVFRDQFQLNLRYQSSSVGSGAYFVQLDGRTVQFWTHGEPLDSRKWIPSFDWPNFKATSEFIFRVPGDWKVLSQGKLIGTKTESNKILYHWKEDVKLPPYLFSILAGDMKIFDGPKHEIPIQFWLPQRENEANLLGFKEAGQMLDFYSHLLRPYAFEKFDVGIAYEFLGAMEHASSVTFSQTLASQNSGYDSVVFAHELVHHWFGNLVTCQTWNDLWLNEGFANYFEALYWEKKEGREKLFTRMESYKKRYLSDEAKNKNAMGAIFNPSTLPSQKFNSVAYEKGALALHQLRYTLGDERFFKGIRAYLEKYKYSSANTENLKDVLQKTTGVNLKGFFDQWIYRPLYSEFTYSWNYSSQKATVKIQQGTEFYSTPMDIWFSWGDKIIKKRVNLRPVKSQEFEFSFNQKPKAVLLDPEHWILGVINGVKEKEEWLEILKNGPTVPVRLDAIKGLGKDLTWEMTKMFLESEKQEYVKYGLLNSVAKNFGGADVSADVKAEVRLVNLSYLNSSSDYMRMSAAQNMGVFGKPEDEEKLLEIFKSDPSPYASMYAGFALAGLGGEKTIDAFLAELYMEPMRDLKLVSAAITGLGALGGNKAADRLVELFQKGFKNARFVKAVIASSLAVFKDGRATKLICDELIKERQPDLSMSYMSSLEKLADPRALPTLRLISEDETRTSREKKAALDLINKLESVKI